MLSGIVLLILGKRGIPRTGLRVLAGVTLILLGMCAFGASVEDEVDDAGGSTTENVDATTLTENESDNMEEAEPPAPSPRRSEWRLSKAVDNFDGEIHWYASSKRIRPDTRMSFPYGGTRSELKYGCSNGPNGFSEWAFFWFSNSPNLINDEIQDGYDIHKARSKWDDSIETITLTQTWGEDILHFRYDDWGINAMKNHDRAMLELQWFEEGRVTFTYSLIGAKETIEEARANCVAKKSYGRRLLL